MRLKSSIPQNLVTPGIFCLPQHCITALRQEMFILDSAYIIPSNLLIMG